MKVLSWILFTLYSIVRLWNIQIRGQYENSDAMKEFTRTLCFKVSTYLKILANACGTGFLTKLTNITINIQSIIYIPKV